MRPAPQIKKEKSFYNCNIKKEKSFYNFNIDIGVDENWCQALQFLNYNVYFDISDK